MQIDRYQEVVQRLAKEKIDSRFSNKGPEHARVVVETMFRHASSSVNLFTGCLNKDFYTSEPVLESLKDFLARTKGALTIICASTPDSDTVSVIKQSEFGSNVQIRVLSPAEAGTGNHVQHHFMTADGVAYRLEVNDAAREAVVNFNEPAVAMTLNNWFDAQFALSNDHV